MALRAVRTIGLVAVIVLAVSAMSLALADAAAPGRSPHRPGGAVRSAKAGFPALGVSAGAQLAERPAALRDRELDDDVALGVGWIRHDIAWDVVEPQRGVWSWSSSDALVDGVTRRGLQLIATLSYTPAWANGGHDDHRFAPRSAADFGAFARQVAQRYAPRGVHVYEIWNEPNIGFWQPQPDPAGYARVLKAAYGAIHAIDPQAVVISGGVSPAGDGPDTVSPHRWISQLYANGAGKVFDAIGVHPYVDADAGALSTDPGNPWYQMAGSSPSVRSIQADHGDSAKRIWATEVGCRRSVGDCAARLQQAAALWRTYPWAGVLAWFTYWDPNEYGLVAGDWTHRPTWNALHDAASAYR